MADDLLAAVVLASRAPMLIAPAMNVNMWEHPLTQDNLQRLSPPAGSRTIGPDRGELACGWIGAGRLVDPSEVVAQAEAILARRAPRAALSGKQIVVTAGPTFEAVDDVRFLGNRSSGKMGFALAGAAATLGAEVILIAGPVALATPGGVAPAGGRGERAGHAGCPGGRRSHGRRGGDGGGRGGFSTRRTPSRQARPPLQPTVGRPSRCRCRWCPTRICWPRWGAGARGSAPFPGGVRCRDRARPRPDWSPVPAPS